MKLARFLLVLLFMSLTVSATAEVSDPSYTGSLSEPNSIKSKATLLYDIGIERTGEETRVHLKTDGTINNYREVRLKKNVAANRPDRMYLDIKNVLFAHPLPIVQVGTALARVRTGLRADGIRVVFDSGLDELFDYTISEQPDGLLVTIREPSVANPAIADMMEGNESGNVSENIIAPAEETIYPEPKSTGNLDLLIVTSDTPDQTEEWLGSSSDGKTGLQILKTVKPDQVINTSFLVTGVTLDSNGDYSVEVSFTLLDPNGKPMENRRGFAKTTGHASTTPAFFKADPMLGITLGETDPAGEYTIIGLVEDLSNNKIVRRSRSLALEK